jgi:hypothetical protein
MKNKLLLSSALVGSLIAGSAAYAQTSVTGNLAINYRAQEFKASNGAASTRGFGRESQINVSNKGSLNNGMTYAAGFSLEFDGQARNTIDAIGAQSMVAGTESNTISNENLYIDFISGTTTLTVGVDHIQNITTDSIPQVLPVFDNVAAGIGGKATNTVGANPKEAFGVGIVQVIPGSGLTASALYVPKNGDYGSGDQVAPMSGVAAKGVTSAVADGITRIDGARNSAYELGVVGSNALGVKGLAVRAFLNREESMTSAVPNLNGSHYGASYTTGPFAVGASKHKQNRTAGTSPVDANQSTKSYGLTYAATKDITVGVAHLRTDLSNTTLVEKITSYQVGYNLGPVGVAFAYSDIKDLGATSATGADAKELQLRLTTNF